MERFHIDICSHVTSLTVGAQGSKLSKRNEPWLQRRWPHSSFKELRGPYRYREHHAHSLFHSLPRCLEDRNLGTWHPTPILPYVQAVTMPLKDIQEIPALVEPSRQQRSTKHKKLNMPQILPHRHVHLTTPQLQHHLLRQLRNYPAPPHPKCQTSLAA